MRGVGNHHHNAGANVALIPVEKRNRSVKAMETGMILLIMDIEIDATKLYRLKKSQDLPRPVFIILQY
jgi:hypothetical protein